jgi:hypothetical protein
LPDVSRILAGRGTDLAALTEGLFLAAVRFGVGLCGAARDLAGMPRDLAVVPFFFFIGCPLSLNTGNQRSERPTAEQMDVQVIDLLAAVRIAVDDQPITAVGDALLSREIARHDEHVSNQRFIFVGDIVGGWNGLVRDNEYVDGGCGPDIQKSNDAGIAVEHRCRQLAGDDFLEKRRHFNASEATGASRLAGTAPLLGFATQ